MRLYFFNFLNFYSISLAVLNILSTSSSFLSSRSHRASVHRITSSSSLTTITTLWGQRGKRIRREKRLAQQEPTPPRLQTPYGPIRLPKPPRVCYTCRGRGLTRCHVCEGRGVQRASGLRKKNQILRDKLIHSKWTSVEIRYGHRHHTVMETRGSPKVKESFECRMRNCCGEANDYWISVDELREKSMWRQGWVTLEDIRKADGGALHDIKVCFCCKGNRVLQCIECDGKGEIPSFEPLYND